MNNVHAVPAYYMQQLAIIWQLSDIMQAPACMLLIGVYYAVLLNTTIVCSRIECHLSADTKIAVRAYTRISIFNINMANTLKKSNPPPEIEWSVPNLASIYCGVQARIRQLVVYTHCRGYNDNLTIVHVSREPLVRSMVDTVQQIAFSFNYSAQKLRDRMCSS